MQLLHCKGVANTELFSGTWVGGGIWDKVGWDEVEWKLFKATCKIATEVRIILLDIQLTKCVYDIFLDKQ